MEEWYEVAIERDNAILTITTTESLEEAENMKEDLKKKGLNAVVRKWALEQDISKMTGEI